MNIISGKPIHWLGDSLEVLRACPPEARARAGQELRRVQTGADPLDSKPMATVGLGVSEIRIHAKGEYRVFYVAKFAEAVYVLHAFVKKTRRSARADIELGKARYREMLKLRRVK
jgi:phage-related protein